MGRIVINGKFVGQRLNGVHRTAAHYTAALLARAGRDHDLTFVAPRASAPDPNFPGLSPQIHPGWFGAGQGWEMLTLPMLAHDALLVNFCNLAPLLHRNSVVMIHDAQTFLYPEDYSGLQGSAYRALLPMIARRARHILTVSEFAKASLVEHGIGTPDKISSVHNGTDHILDCPPDAGILAKHGLTPGSFAMTLGSAKGYKNIRRVFDAFVAPAPAGLRLVVAGGPPAGAYAAKGWQAPDGTIFTGFISDAELRALYQAAAVFLFPSLTEGFGLPPIEAMHCGTPVIAAAAGAMPEVCGAAALLVPPHDTDAWRRSITQLAQDAQARSALLANGHARAAGLTWAAAGDRLWSVLRPLIDPQG